MSNVTSIIRAKEIMGTNYIGPEELACNNVIRFECSQDIEDVPYSEEELLNKKEDYILIYGTALMNGETPVTIRSLKNIFGEIVKDNLPVFYTQDWYDKEDFINNIMDEGWFLIRKNPYEDSRAVQPTDLMKSYNFPSAIKCVYAFFVSWIVLDIKLWYTDFVWCSDVDHNGDRIYVGKYHDVDGINRDGFSIHRHLALRSCYTCID